MITYTFLQHYWWCIISLLGALLVFLLFVQGGNSLIFSLGRTEAERSLLINSTGRKWEFTFTTLVTFGGAFFASFPLFYSTSFGGAYWLWMLILLGFVLQAVSYEFQSKKGNLLGRGTYRRFLVFNGVTAPVLLGAAVASFFEGAAFSVDKGAMADQLAPAISRWANAWHGLDTLVGPWNLILGLAVLFLARLLGTLYFINNLADAPLVERCRRQLRTDAVPFVLLFVAFAGHVFSKSGLVFQNRTDFVVRPLAYLESAMQSPWIAAVFIAGVVCVLYGVLRSAFDTRFTKGIWAAGIGTVLTVFALLVLAGWNGMAYYPSTVCPAGSLTLSNSCSSEFTLGVMAIVSVLVPFVLAYIAHAWYAIDRRSLTYEELENDEHVY